MRSFKREKRICFNFGSWIFLWIPIQQLKLCRKSIFCSPREPQPQRWFITVTMSLWPETRSMPCFHDFPWFSCVSKMQKKWMVTTCNYHTKRWFWFILIPCFSQTHAYNTCSTVPNTWFLVPIAMTAINLPHGFPSLPMFFQGFSWQGLRCSWRPIPQWIWWQRQPWELRVWRDSDGKVLPGKVMSPFWKGVETKHTPPPKF